MVFARLLVRASSSSGMHALAGITPDYGPEGTPDHALGAKIVFVFLEQTGLRVLSAALVEYGRDIAVLGSLLLWCTLSRKKIRLRGDTSIHKKKPSHTPPSSL